MSGGGPPKTCIACGGRQFTAPKDIHGYVPATFGWFGDPLVGFACATCGFVHLYLKPRKRASDRVVGKAAKGDPGDSSGSRGEPDPGAAGEGGDGDAGAEENA